MVSKRNYGIFVIILLAILMISIMNIAYAMTEDKANNVETKYLTGDFDIIFNNPKIEKSTGVETDNTFISAINSKNLKINISNFNYPGAGIEFSADIENKGNFKAKLNGIIIKGLDNSDIKAYIVGTEYKNKILEPGEKQNIHLIVYWDYNSTNQNLITSDFTISLDYSQVI